MEKRGIAYCASDFSKHQTPARTVFAKPVFVAANTAHDSLPLTDLYDHIDYIDLISAQEFGLEGLFPGRFLLCVVVAQTVPALGQMEEMISGCATGSVPSACADSAGGTLLVGAHRAALSDSAQELLQGLSGASPEEVLAALTHWCVGYRVQIYLPEDMA